MHDIDNLTFPESASEITEQQILFFRENPEKLNLIFDREVVQSRLLMRVFVAAILMVAGSKVIGYKYTDLFSQFINDVVVDLIFECGAALLGAVATAFFIEMQQKKKFEENLKLRNLIEARIQLLDEQEKTVKNSTDTI